MNDKQKLEMIAMCAQALADGKQLQYKFNKDADWQPCTSRMHNVASDILVHDYEYRIKPEPKTLQYRVGLFFMVDHYYTYTLTYESAYDPSVDKEFVKWLTDVITVELPE